MVIRKILISCIGAGCLMSANASNSNVASLTDLKEAIHFLLKDYNTQKSRFNSIDSQLQEMGKDIAILKDSAETNKTLLIQTKENYNRINNQISLNSNNLLLERKIEEIEKKFNTLNFTSMNNVGSNKIEKIIPCESIQNNKDNSGCEKANNHGTIDDKVILDYIKKNK